MTQNLKDKITEALNLPYADFPLKIIRILEEEGFQFRLESTCYEGKYMATFTSPQGEEVSDVAPYYLVIASAASKAVEKYDHLSKL